MLIADYKPIMYAETEYLRTGDILRLDFEDFKSFVRHESILPLFQQFEGDASYSAKLWVLLNQPCDMVHDPENGRYFKSNVFLAPLQGLMSALRKGVIGDLVYFEDVRQPENVFIESYKTYLKSKIEAENPKGATEQPKDYGLRIHALIEPTLKRIEEELEPVKGQFHDPTDVLNVMKEYLAADANLVNSIEELGGQDLWKKGVAKFETTKAEAEKRNNSLILKANAQDRLASLGLNQLDSQGVFFYEPHAEISNKETDLAFVVLLQDMITVKVKKESQTDGSLYKLLLSKRALSLSENFSDRLLNIMGNYFSKIGTGDVRSDKIIELYSTTFAGHFFTSEKEYTKFHAAKAEAAKTPS